MKLEVPKRDMRSSPMSSDSIIDKETGRAVGGISLTGHPNGRRVHLFGGRYVGCFTTHEECVAFVEGVEAVLNEMQSFRPISPSHEDS